MRGGGEGARVLGGSRDRILRAQIGERCNGGAVETVLLSECSRTRRYE